MSSSFIAYVFEVLEAAKDAGDMEAIAACRRIIVANRHARRADASDLNMVKALYEGLKD